MTDQSTNMQHYIFRFADLFDVLEARYDKDADWDDHLGGFSIDITAVINNSTNKSMMQWFKLDDGAKGEVRLQLCFLELSQNKVHHG